MVGNGDNENSEKAEATALRNRILTAVALGLVAALTAIVLVVFFISTKRAREGAIANALAANHTPGRLYGASLNYE